MTWRFWKVLKKSLMVLVVGLPYFGADAAPLQPASATQVDLNRYAGRWYEIAKIPNRFQDQCVKNTTAEYSLRDDGGIDVLNTCVIASGDLSTARGVARVVDDATKAKLEVSFVSFLGWNLFWGDYWILGLGENYEFSVVGTRDRRYGWILSRTSVLDKEAMTKAREVLERNGYDLTDFRLSYQETAL